MKGILLILSITEKGQSNNNNNVNESNIYNIQTNIYKNHHKIVGLSYNQQIKILRTDIRDYQKLSKVIRSYGRLPMVIRGYRRLSEVIEGYVRLSKFL